MVDAHGVVGGNRSVDEGPGGTVRQLCAQLIENPVLRPPCEDALLHGGVCHLSVKGLEHLAGHGKFDAPQVNRAISRSDVLQAPGNRESPPEQANPTIWNAGLKIDGKCVLHKVILAGSKADGRACGKAGDRVG